MELIFAAIVSTSIVTMIGIVLGVGIYYDVFNKTDSNKEKSASELVKKD